MIRPELEPLLAKWQAALRLLDWEIKIRYARIHELPLDVQGQCKAVAVKKEALIKIIDPADWDPAIAWPQDIEKTLVHELLHVHFSLIHDRFEGLTDACYEQAIDAIASSLVKLAQRVA